mmetsp:Transcript_50688/g.109490  ORF Transcript_50688/g.109490 Transcript_50688/m.109490 type:complete len:216 (-) Transcript_50688:34-681(-)|eukprot:CAMPEP_0206474920 /NCGR_PEP_ID=MMETSP0324_2-20121206/33775_1 /ASSEMBLY_ACC=CAM_ASM_000836 /TAXON_ID=2866 /ORGANISM="Crypthecodinium cohnii, Strain Seligo" /LENGTH=215 /DNA_ID=CAMNT_0053950187 /DNA_START=77 /DNA_END=724 /DNA_ORIENTATION=+
MKLFSSAAAATRPLMMILLVCFTLVAAFVEGLKVESSAGLQERALEEELEGMSRSLLAAVAVNTTASSVKSANRTAVLSKQQDVLQGLLSHLKESIKKMNKREADGKEEGKKQTERLEKRLADEKAKLKQTNLSKFQQELLANRTRTDEEELKYWARSRTLEHGLFHSSLKVTHGLMKKADAVIAAYDSVLKTGKLPAGMADQLKAVSKTLTTKH